MMFTSFMLLLLFTLFQGSQGGGFDKCGTDDRCDLIGANLDGNNIVLPKGKEYIETSSKDDCACQCQTWGVECKAWTWIMHGKRCYLKTRASRPQFGAAFASYISGQKECQCVTNANNCIESGLRYDTVPGGADILDKILITSAIGCSCACHRLRNCLVWTFNKNVVKNGKSECTLLARATTRVQEAGFDSAVVNCDYVSRPSVCVSGWTEFKGACYFLQQEKKDWDSANAACQLQQPKKFNAQLTSILNDEEYKFLQKMAGSSEFWMGANRQPRTWYLPREKWFWEWTDGSNWKYTKWAHGEPNGHKGRQFCGAANWGNAKLWDDGTCDYKRISICKYRIAPAVPAKSCADPKLLESSRITCTASSEFSGDWGCQKAFDGKAQCNNNWGSDWASLKDEGVGAWIKAEFVEVITIKKLRIKQRQILKHTEHMNSGIEIAFDGGVKKDFKLGVKGCNSWNIINLSEPVATRTMKIRISSVYGPPDNNGFKEIEIYGCI